MAALPTFMAGDVLLYNIKWDFVDWAIRTRTWSDVAHVEVSMGDGTSLASRNGIGVGQYAHRANGLVKVRRPTGILDIYDGMDWFTGVNHTPYGTGDLWRFYGIDVATKGLICSTFAAMFFAACHEPLFGSDYPPEVVTPRDFEVLPDSVLKTIFSI